MRGRGTGALAFADYIVVLADSIENQDHADQVVHYMNKLGMTPNPSKSPSLLIKIQRNNWIVRDPGLSVGETMVPCARYSSVLKYLGVH
jgi:hypothetical protein